MKFNINESEREAILGMHKSAKILTENEMFQAAEKEKKVVAKAKEKTEKLSDNEKEILKDFIEGHGPNVFMNLVKQELNAAKGEREVTEEDENEDSEKPKKLDTGMDETELQVRAIIDRIITYTGVGSMLGVIPAMMFISGGVALGLGLYSLAALGLKDVAWWKKLDTSKPMPGSGIRGGGVYHKEADKARKDWMN